MARHSEQRSRRLVTSLLILWPWLARRSLDPMTCRLSSTILQLTWPCQAMFIPARVLPYPLSQTPQASFKVHQVPRFHPYPPLFLEMVCKVSQKPQKTQRCFFMITNLLRNIATLSTHARPRSQLRMCKLMTTFLSSSKFTSHHFWLQRRTKLWIRPYLMNFLISTPSLRKWTILTTSV